MFEYILSLEDEISSTEIDIEGKKYPIEKRTELLELAANVVLILNGARNGYKKCSIDNEFPDRSLLLMKKIVEFDNSLMILPFSLDYPVIMLKTNLRLIPDNVMDDISLSQILSYRYNGLDWSWVYGDTYGISFIITEKQSGIQASLYGFSVPINKYTDNIRQEILNDLQRYQTILSQYNLEVRLMCLHYPQSGEMPDIIELP